MPQGFWFTVPRLSAAFFATSIHFRVKNERDVSLYPISLAKVLNFGGVTVQMNEEYGIYRIIY